MTMRQRPGPGEGQGGFAAVDALVAVTILSSSLALSLMAVQIAARASRAAGETHDAELLLRDILERTAGQAGVWRGRDQGLDWSAETQISHTSTSPGRRAEPCLRVAQARGTSGRAYRIATADICQPGAR